MRIDLLHNRIVADNITAGFRESFENDLVPMLTERYGRELNGVLMYEDYLSLDFLLDGEWYYPLTVFVDGAPRTSWVKWRVDGNFKNGCPYSYVGDGAVDFSLPDAVPEELSAAMLGRAIAYGEGSIGVRVVGASKDTGFLIGKYSQTFVDELARQITAELSRVLSVEGIGGGTMELQLVFAPDTYMEHTSENVTYRRLLLTDKGCQPRDFWVKWTRLDGVSGYSVTDNVTSDNVRFELGEDVPQKIREKEYRFLCRANPDKYQSAMGKKTVTEWRELIKRSVKRGELIKLEVAEVAHDDDLDSRLRAVLGDYAAVSATEPAPTVDDSDIARMARAALGGEDETVEYGDADSTEIESEEEYTEEESEATVTDTEEQTPEDIDFAFGLDLDGDDDADSDADDSNDGESDTEEAREPVTPVVSEADYSELERLREERLRREIEAKLRLEYESEARAKAEAEAARLRAEHERLREENEKLREEARLREEQARREEAERVAEEARRREAEARRLEEEERTRARIAEQARLEEAERARLAEIARKSIEEQNRLDAERAEREAREREERERLERERLAREEAARRAEAERLERERLAREEEERRRAQPTYVTKHAKLIFRRAVDLNVIKRIKEIVEQTLVDCKKTHIHIYMKAYPIDAYTINLDMKLPDTEGELLVTIVKAIGNGHLGITKIIVE